MELKFPRLAYSLFVPERYSRNIVGPQIRKLRYQQGLTQELLAARCGAKGLDLSRTMLAKIENGLREVTDRELVQLARALRVDLIELFPPGAFRHR